VDPSTLPLLLDLLNKNQDQGTQPSMPQAPPAPGTTPNPVVPKTPGMFGGLPYGNMLSQNPYVGQGMLGANPGQ
jgi:hypothetical protein